MAMVFCRGCGKEIHETAWACPHCGAPQSPGQDGPLRSLKDQTIAALLCAFLGAFGGHRFYLGKNGSGIIYILLCWTGIPTIIALVELIMIAFASPQKWANQYNNGQLMPPIHIIAKVLAIIWPIFFVLVFVGTFLALLLMDEDDRTADFRQTSIQGETIWSPSFDCAKASTGVERLICENREFAEADIQMAQVYQTALENSQDKDALKRSQRAWLKKERDVCADAPCILTAYRDRIVDLSQ